MAYEQYLRSQMRVIGGPKWDQLIRDIASDFAALKEAKSAQEILADSLLRRGLQVIEDLVSPVALLAGQRVDQIDALITEGTENVNAAVADAVAAASGIADMLAGLQAGGVDAELVIESADRVFLTPEQKTAFIGYAAAIALLAPLASPAFTGTPTGPTATTGDNSTKLATTAFVANAIDALKGAAPEALDTLYEIAAKLADDDTAISGILTALGNRLRVVKISNNLGDAKSIVTHPATTTHQRLKPEARASLGISEGLLRLSVGLEHPDDLLADLAQAARA